MVCAVFGGLILTLGWWGYTHLWNAPGCAGNYELVIRNGMVLDGMGGAPFPADIAISSGRVACIGSVKKSPGERGIEAAGMMVAPGFIDVHTHVERNLPEGSTPFLAPNFVRQGVTTIITGNCGSSTLGVRTMLNGLDRSGSQVNVATFVGHNSIRRSVMQRANRTPTAQELRQMRQAVVMAMDEGALGLSTGLAYIPGTYSQTEEVVELARAAAEREGLYVSHIRDEGRDGLAAVKEAIDIGEQAGLPVHISHFKASGRGEWGKASQRLELVDAALSRGQRVTIDQYPYTASSTSLDLLLPSWALEGSQAEVGQRMRNPQNHARIRSEMLARLSQGGWADYSFARIAYCSANLALNGLTIPQVSSVGTHHTATGKNSAPQPQPHIVTRTTAESQGGDISVERQADTILDLIARGGAQMIYFDMDEGDLSAIMRHPDTMFGSDSAVRYEDTKAVPHPRGLGTFPRVLSHYVRETDTLSLGEAVRRMTSLSAKTFGFPDRGQISVGYWADLVIFSEQSILDKSTYEMPLAAPEGIPYVIVNGQIVFDNYRFTGINPGKTIRRGLASQ